MNHIEKRQLIKEQNLDKDFYFQSLLAEVCRLHLLEKGEYEKIQLELIELLAKQVERYTNNESSSIPIEKAQDLIQSITYCIGVYLKTISDMNYKIELLKSEKISTLFYFGIDKISSLMLEAKSMLKKLQENSLKVDNIAYHDTLFIGIPKFFYDYNIEFAAHDNAGDIDYPLCDTITALMGIEYLYDYLEKLTIENNFCRKFSQEKIQMLLRGVHRESEHFLLNIFELVLTNALGCELTERNITNLLLDENDLEWLQGKMQHFTKEELEEKLNLALEHITKKLNLEQKSVTYAKKAIVQIVVRMKENLQTGTLVKFLIPYSNLEEKQDVLFDDGYQMEDEKLRDLIEEMKECKNTNDKIIMIRERVNGLNDLTELLEECFYAEEYEEVFLLLDETELDYLRKGFIQNNDSGFEELDSLKVWQNQLLDYERKFKCRKL